MDWLYSAFLLVLEMEVARFLIAGGIAAIFYYAIFLWLVERRDVRYVIASWTAFAPSFAVNFALQKAWAFRSEDALGGELSLFGIKYFVLQNANVLLLGLFVKRGQFSARWAQVTTGAILSVVSYVASHFIFAT